MLLPYDEFGNLLKPVPRPCGKMHGKNQTQKSKCPDCCPCYCPVEIRQGVLYDCAACITALGGPAKAKELGVNHIFCKHLKDHYRCGMCRDENRANGKAISNFFCQMHYAPKYKCLECRAEKPGVARCPHELPLTYSCRACRSQWSDDAQPDYYWPGCEAYFKSKAAKRAKQD